MRALGLAMLAAICIVAGAAAASAQIMSAGISTFQAPPDPHWRKITIDDLGAAYRMLRDNHPGAAPSLHDTAFVKELTDAYQRALGRAKTVSSYQGYSWTLEGFATDMGDKHIWDRPLLVMNLPWWAGIIVSQHGSDYVVTDTEIPQKSLLGATLISCDGKPASDLAHDNLAGFRAVWSVGAQQIQAAPWLFVDEGNPFIKRPQVCVFAQGGKPQTVTLDWERIKREILLPRLHTAIGAGVAGFGVRKVGDGYWIALQSLMGDQAPQVVKAVEAQSDAMREAKFVVLDMRGNGGGSSLIGRQIAAALLGPDAVKSRLPDDVSGGCDDENYRATKDNARNFHFITGVLAAKGYYDAATQKQVDAQGKKLDAAVARGAEFASSVDCLAEPATPVSSTQVPSKMRGRLILLTDALCFSSCLAVTGDFRALGAYHIGQTTDAATHFVDVREQYLPSGYSVFSTLTAVGDPHGDDEVGPFVPNLTYPGDIADTAAVEKWVTDVVVPKAGNP